MESTEDSDPSTTVNNYESGGGGGKSFINKLLFEMKNQFNKADKSPESNGTEERRKPDAASDDSERKISKPEDKPNGDAMLVFKKPKTDSPSRKEASPGRRSLRLKNEDVPQAQSLPKRSSRRRSKDCNESILQSAIARKEKSYYESSKPQRLTRLLKATPKILSNLALARQEKNKSKSPKDSDSDVQQSDDTSSSDTPKKTRKKQSEVTKVRTKRMKLAQEESDRDSESEESVDSENNVRSPKSTRRSLRLSRNKEDCDIPSNPSPNIADQANNSPNDPECSSVGDNLFTSRLCTCLENRKIYRMHDSSDIVYCNAMDSINDKLIGCSRIVDVKAIPLLRPSQRIPYLSLCDMHSSRLARHNCCPTCGIFCTEGYFMECEAKHQHHKNCQITINNTECCPHCGLLSSSSRNVYIEMHLSSRPVFLPVQTTLEPQAKMVFPDPESSKECPAHLIPPEMFQVDFESHSQNQKYTVDDLIDAVKDENIARLIAIIASDSMNLDFKIPDFNDGTLLHYAAHKGLLKVCHLLVMVGMEIDQFDKEQATPLILAINKAENEVVRYLVSVGASVNIKATHGMTPLHHAAKAGNLSACRLLLSSVVSRPQYLDQRDDGGWTALVWAAEHSRAEVVRYLLSEGADPKATDVEQNQALHWAAFGGGYLAALALLEGGAEVDPRNAHGETPLHFAAREDQYNCAIVLLTKGADVTIVNKNNETPLECVPSHGDCYNAIAMNVRLLANLKTDYRKYKTILSNDISKGKELNPIQCVNSVDEETEPQDYTYVTKYYITSDTIKLESKLGDLHACKCEERCVESDCECAKLSGKCWYDEEGKLTSDFNFANSPTILECNDACDCNVITCRNRVVQKGLQQRFQLFKTEHKGWGIKTLRNILKGSFVCEYIGEILTDADFSNRENDSFIFDLDSKDEEAYSVDARHFGNLARFINHSCNPNLHPVRTFVEHQDLRFPKIAMFSKRDIQAEEELSFDYGPKFWSVKANLFPCRCAHSQCKYSGDDGTSSGVK